MRSLIPAYLTGVSTASATVLTGESSWVKLIKQQGVRVDGALMLWQPVGKPKSKPVNASKLGIRMLKTKITNSQVGFKPQLVN